MKQLLRQPARSHNHLTPPQPDLSARPAPRRPPAHSNQALQRWLLARGVQASLRVGPVDDPYEREADRVAEAVVQGAQAPRLAGWTSAHLQRQTAKDESEKYKEAAKKVGEAFLKTKLGKQIVARGEALGKAFWRTLGGKIVTGAAAAATLSALIAANKELPVQVPEIPLDVLTPGLRMKLTYEGPLRSPTKAMISFSYRWGGGKPSAAPKAAATESERLRRETARLAQQLSAFRQSMKTPAQRAQEQQWIYDAIARQVTDPSSPLYLPGLKRSSHPPSPKRPKEEKEVQRKAAMGDRQRFPAPPAVQNALRGSGQPLSANVRTLMEARIGHDFSRVRIHADERAAEAARAIHARAFTYGHDIVFAAGAYQPHTSAGQRLLAHELAHVVQQRHYRQGGYIQRQFGEVVGVVGAVLGLAGIVIWYVWGEGRIAGIKFPGDAVIPGKYIYWFPSSTTKTLFTLVKGKGWFGRRLWVDMIAWMSFSQPNENQPLTINMGIYFSDRLSNRPSGWDVNVRILKKESTVYEVKTDDKMKIRLRTWKITFRSVVDELGPGYWQQDTIVELNPYNWIIANGWINPLSNQPDVKITHGKKQNL